jgi:chromosome segregation ATPase
MASRLLERQILELEQEIIQLESLKNSNFALEEQISLVLGDMEHSRMMAGTKKQKLEQDLKKYEKEGALMESKLKVEEGKVEDLEEQIEGCCEDFERKESECQREEERLEEIEEKTAELDAENKETEGECLEQSRENKRSKQKNTELKDEIFEKDNAQKSVMKQKEELQRAVLEIEGTIKRVDKEEFEYESMLVRKQQKESDLETESEYLIKELEMYRDERDRLELDINDLSLGVKSLKEGSLQMDQMKTKNQLLLESLREEKIRLITQVEMKRTRSRNQKEQIEKIEEKIKEMDVQAEHLSRQSQQCTLEKGQLEREVQRQKEVNARVRHLMDGQKYLEGFLEKSLMKNQSLLNQI